MAEKIFSATNLRLEVAGIYRVVFVFKEIAATSALCNSQSIYLCFCEVSWRDETIFVYNISAYHGRPCVLVMFTPLLLLIGLSFFLFLGLTNFGNNSYIKKLVGHFSWEPDINYRHSERLGETKEMLSKRTETKHW